MALYMLSFISCSPPIEGLAGKLTSIADNAIIIFMAALFPRLARNTPHSREVRKKHEDGEIPREKSEHEESMEKNRISNISIVGFTLLSSGLV